MKYNDALTSLETQCLFNANGKFGLFDFYILMKLNMTISEIKIIGNKKNLKELLSLVNYLFSI